MRAAVIELDALREEKSTLEESLAAAVAEREALASRLELLHTNEADAEGLAARLARASAEIADKEAALRALSEVCSCLVIIYVTACGCVGGRCCSAEELRLSAGAAT